MSFTKSILYIFLFSIVSFTGFSQGFLKAEGKKIVNAKGENVLLRGFGLGGWMLQEGYMLKINQEAQQYRIRERIEELMGPKQTQEFYDAWLANHMRKIDVDSMKRWGFNSIRLPMHYNLYTLPADKEPVAGKNTWLEKGFALTDSLLAWCKANKMYLILDLHAAPGGQGNDLNIADRDPSKPYLWDSEANQEKTIALWKKLAERYKDEPYIGAYDILNEPNYGFSNPEEDKNGTKEKVNAPLRKLMVEITKAIREVDQRHIIIIEGNGWGNNYNGIFPLWDKNMVLSYHKYWNYNDQASIAHIIKARDEQHVPVWLGETGENSNVWFTDAIHLLEKNNIGWAWWPLKKIGANNPMEIKSNPNYDALVKYFNNGGDKPKDSNVYSGLMELAIYSRLENTIIHRDVIDAMIRQPFSNETKPFKPSLIRDKSIVYAVDYDLGKNGKAYFDTDTADYHTSTGKRSAGNHGRIYRNDGVDIAKDSTQYEKYYVNHIEKGEWLQYTVNVSQRGTYTLKINAAADNTSGRMTIMIDNKVVAKDIAVPNTVDHKKFATFAVKNIVLKAGKQKIKVLADAGGYNFGYIQFVK
ncbi:Endoglucanase C307 [Pedobacter sp. Bi27]|uniref:cellulase family glycosylhydrolase n=1 Tax=unclassified Pedobacter TaxID=2628915 RepID=UPI001DCC4F04|nr:MULTISPECIES: cellulase family glycosylhydrolase [unclassified Pedobacter]CAH0229752.1 Endoglucanase C307 [Pedobacter sp. Bi27]CAH0242983.1 Endoglucanase C307 [Pedobacter sp. Bi36]CAH0268772.1 Endoglucanase C307 [Pedobacter sp. Bi126]